MRILKRALLAQFLACTAVPAFPQEYYTSPEGNPFSDPAFQDYVETVYGYKNPAAVRLRRTDKSAAASRAADLRDALASLPAATPGSALAGRRPADPVSPPDAQTGADRPYGAENLPADARKSGNGQDYHAVLNVRERLPGGLTGPAQGYYGPQAGRPAAGQYYKVTFANESGPLSAFVAPLAPDGLSGFKFGEYVFVSILPASTDYAALADSLSEAGFKFAGEKTYFYRLAKKTFLLGWAPHSRLPRIRSHPGVRRVAIEKKACGAPFRTRIRFTLRAPAGERSGAFVSDFLKELNARAGFASESVVRLSRDSGHAKFTGFDVTGSLPMDMISALAQSPFVVAVELADNSL